MGGVRSVKVMKVCEDPVICLQASGAGVLTGSLPCFCTLKSRPMSCTDHPPLGCYLKSLLIPLPCLDSRAVFDPQLQVTR